MSFLQFTNQVALGQAAIMDSHVGAIAAAHVSGLGQAPSGCTIVGLPAGFTAAQRGGLLTLIWSHLRDNTVGGGRARWASTIMSYMAITDPVFEGFALANRVERTELTVAEADALGVWYEYNDRKLGRAGGILPYEDSIALGAAAVAPGAIAGLAAVEAATQVVEGLDLGGANRWLTTNPAAFTTESFAAGFAIVPYGTCGIILYIAGKPVSPATLAVFTTTRPGNIVNRYGILPARSHTLTGAHRMSDQAFTEIAKMWGTHLGFRMTCIKEIANLRSRIVSIEQDALATVALLLEWADMSHISIIASFLASHPRSRLNPRLKPEIDMYLSSLRAMRKLPPLEQPLIKVIYGTNFKLCRQEDVKHIFWVALQTLRRSDRMLDRFATPAGAVAEHALYIQWVTEKQAEDDAAAEAARNNGMPIPMIEDDDSY